MFRSIRAWRPPKFAWRHVPKIARPPIKCRRLFRQRRYCVRDKLYVPFEIQGNNLTLYGDAEGTALVKGEARRFAITAQGTNISIVGAHVEGATHEGDLEQWLCLYPRCPFTPEIGGAAGLWRRGVVEQYVERGGAGFAIQRRDDGCVCL